MEIKLKTGQITIVDDEDFEYLNQWKWYLRHNGYAYRRDKNGRAIFMHRVINNTPDDLITDHINRNKLDNRKENLRSADKSLNAINSKMSVLNKTGVKGCYFEKRVSKFRVQIKVNLKQIHLGYFSKIEDASLARKIAENKYYAI